jgi:hypothetical protein
MAVNTSDAVEFFVSTEGQQYSRGSFYFVYQPERRLEELPTRENSTSVPGKNYAENILIRRILHAVLIRASHNTTVVVEGCNLLNGDAFPIDSCCLGPVIGPAELLRNDTFLCHLGAVELSSVGSYPIQFVSHQFGNISAPNAQCR